MCILFIDNQRVLSKSISEDLFNYTEQKSNNQPVFDQLWYDLVHYQERIMNHLPDTTEKFADSSTSNQEDQTNVVNLLQTSRLQLCFINLISASKNSSVH